MKKILFILFLLILKLSAFGCNCIGKASVEQAYKQSDIVVVGKIIAEKEIIVRYDTANARQKYNEYKIKDKGDRTYEEFLGMLMWKYNMMEYSLVTIKNYKGSKISDTLRVISARYSTACGFRFNTDCDYLLYASKGQDDYVYLSENGMEMGKLSAEIFKTSKCSRTSIYRKNMEDISILEKMR